MKNDKTCFNVYRGCYLGRPVGLSIRFHLGKFYQSDFAHFHEDCLHECLNRKIDFSL